MNTGGKAQNLGRVGPRPTTVARDVASARLVYDRIREEHSHLCWAHGELDGVMPTFNSD